MSAIITDPLSDRELIIEIKKSSHSAFQELFHRYYEKLISFSMYRTLDIDNSKDMVSELFTKLWISRKKLDPDKSIKAYIYKSLTNQIINYSKHSTSKTISLDESITQKVISDNYSQENRIDIYSAVEKLPLKLKTVFLLSRIEGFKYSEIAEICEISVKAVEKRMTKALNKLRKAIL
jgi:RNA polymerase sigma-19 factor, ECF subfamily